MAGFSLALGCALGLMVNAGFAVLFAYWDWSVWSLLPVAGLALLLDRPIEKYNNIWIARRRGGLLRAIFYLLILPTMIFFGLQAAIYFIARAAIG